MLENLFVSVIIPTYRDWDRLRLCLDSLMDQTYPERLLEVIVVNNDQNDLIPELHLPNNIHILTEAKPGSYAARNLGLSVAKGDIFAFTDSDCIPAPDWIEKAVNQLQHGAERVAGHIEFFFRNDKLTMAEIYEKAVEFDQKKSAAGGSSITANMITWRKHFDSVGLFNDALLSGGDNEWGWRAYETGISIVYAPDVIVRHPARAEMHELLSKRRRVVGGMVNVKRTSTQYGRVWMLRGFTPPVREILEIIRRHDLTGYEKFIASYMIYLIKIYTTTQRIKLITGLAMPERV